MNGLTAAKGLRRSVEEAGGSMRISVTALGDAFGRGKLTSRARTGIEQVLGRAGVAVEPSLTAPGNDGWVTLRVGEDVAPPAPAPRGPALWSVPRPPASVIAALALLLPVTIAGAVVSDGDGRPTPSVQDATAAPPQRELTDGQLTEALLAKARAAQREGAYVRAIQLVRGAEGFGRTAETRRILVQSRAGLDLRRDRLRRARGR